jgi:hypothetical protein
MSEFPFQGQTAVADPPAAELEASSGNRTRVMVLVGLAAVAVVGLLAYLFLFSGGDDGTDKSAGAPAAQSPAAPADEPATADEPAKKQKISAKSFGRDPFEPLIVEVVASSSDAGAASDTASGGAATSGGSSGTASGGGSTSDTGSAPSAPSAGTAHSFKVVDVAPDNSTVTVKLDGDTYRNLRAGEVFAEVFKVRFIGGQVNTFQIGDEVFNVSGKKKVTISG